MFLVADESAKLSGRDYEFQEPTLRREQTVRREREFSGDSHGDVEESQPASEHIFGLVRVISSTVITTESSTLCAKKETFH